MFYSDELTPTSTPIVLAYISTDLFLSRQGL